MIIIFSDKDTLFFCLLADNTREYQNLEIPETILKAIRTMLLHARGEIPAFLRISRILSALERYAIRGESAAAEKEHLKFYGLEQQSSVGKHADLADRRA